MNKIISAFALLISITACKKEKNTESKLASINVINAGINAGALKVNNYGRPIYWASYSTQVNNNNNRIYSFSSESKFPLIIIRTADTLNPIYNDVIPINPQDIYSLYIAGEAPNYESLLVKEKAMPVVYPDSTLNVRFVNLSPNSSGINVRLETNQSENEFNDLSYKHITDFKSFDAKSANGNTYVFEVRDVLTDELLATSSIALHTYRFKYITLVFRGIVGGSPSPGITLVKNY